MKNFYVYVFLREDGTPYYVGKGKGKRCYSNDGRTFPRPSDTSRILKLKQNLTEEESFKYERYYIFLYGRKDNGTGILRNLTDGGEGMSGHIPSSETIQKRSQTLKEYWKGRERPSPHNKGIPMTEEQKINLSLKRKGIPNPEHSKRMKGNKNSVGKRKPMSQEEKDKRSRTMKERVKNRKRNPLTGKFL